MNMTRRTYWRSVWIAILALCLCSAAVAGTVSVTVQGPHGTYRVEFFRTGEWFPARTEVGPLFYGARTFYYRGAPGNARYFARVTLIELPLTRRTADGYLGRWWWNNLDLGRINMWP